MTTNTKNVNVFSAYLIRVLLLASGLLAAGIAAMILFAPDAFYTGYGIDVGSNVNLANELKAPAGLLLIAGLLMLIGVFRAGFIIPSLATATVIYLTYGASRLLSMTLDGAPDSALVTAAMLEIAVGTACLFALTVVRRVVA
jgi:hypothetical protein